MLAIIGWLPSTCKLNGFANWMWKGRSIAMLIDLEALHSIEFTISISIVFLGLFANFIGNMINEYYHCIVSLHSQGLNERQPAII